MIAQFKAGLRPPVNRTALQLSGAGEGRRAAYSAYIEILKVRSGGPRTILSESGHGTTPHQRVCGHRLHVGATASLFFKLCLQQKYH
ncbi:hypothetical protein V5799_005246 [Amblyomma americanum]|uniref:Uncharacterized protein n=1 Tax=Amblyomma americanum TaxID=6943 RepID=A0AAQ4DZT4_AMBAM